REVGWFHSGGPEPSGFLRASGSLGDARWNGSVLGTSKVRRELPFEPFHATEHRDQTLERLAITCQCARQAFTTAYLQAVDASRKHLRRGAVAQAVDREVTVECEDRRAVQFVGKGYELSVR